MFAHSQFSEYLSTISRQASPSTIISEEPERAAPAPIAKDGLPLRPSPHFPPHSRGRGGRISGLCTGRTKSPLA